MGIRESLGQPDEKDLNLKNFTIEEEQPEEISIEKLVDQIDWSRFAVFLDGENADIDYYATIDYFTELANYRLIDPEKFDELFTKDFIKDAFWDMNIDEHLGHWLNKNLGFYITPGDVEENPELEDDYVLEKEGEDVIDRGNFLRAIKHLYPENASEINLPDSNWEEVLEELEEICKDKDYPGYLDRMATALQLFPHRQQELRAVCQKSLTEFIDYLKFYLKKNNMYGFLRLGANFRIVFPDEKLPDIFIAENIAKAYETLKKIKDKNSDFFLEHLLCFNILISQDIVITEQELKITMPEKQDYKSKIPPRPERRNF